MIMIPSYGRGLGRGHGNITPALSPTLSRKKRHDTSKAPSAGEGVDRGEIKELCLIQEYMMFSTQQAKISTLDSHMQAIIYQLRQRCTDPRYFFQFINMRSFNFLPTAKML